MIIRVATDKDLTRMTEITRGALSFASSPDPYVWDAASDKELTKRLHDYIRGGTGLALVLEVENALVGFVACRFDELDPRSPDKAAVVDLLAVDEAYRGRTLGTHLIQELVYTLPAHGVTQVHVDVIGSNSDALSFWRRAGFHEHAVTMSIDLAGAESK